MPTGVVVGIARKPHMPDNNTDCPCNVEISWVRVGGTSVTDLLDFFANFFIDNPDDKTIYHCAIKVQFPENGRCPSHVIELTESLDDQAERDRVGEVAQHGIFGPWSYAIRVFRNGSIEDETNIKETTVLSTDCDTARNIVQLARDVPLLDYGEKIGTKTGAADRWSSNSVVSWILQKAGLDPANIDPPSGGIAPGWDAGITQAKK